MKYLNLSKLAPTLVGVFLAMGIGLVAKAPVLAQRDAGSTSAPSQATRTYRSDRFGFSFDFPEHYRAVGLNNGSVMILSPNDFEDMQYIIQNQIPTGFEDPASVSIHFTPVTNRNASLEQMIRADKSWLGRDTRFQRGRFSGRPAVTYVWTFYGATQVSTVAFLSSDQRYLISLSGPTADPVWGVATGSFRFH